LAIICHFIQNFPVAGIMIKITYWPHNGAHAIGKPMSRISCYIYNSCRDNATYLSELVQEHLPFCSLYSVQGPRHGMGLLQWAKKPEEKYCEDFVDKNWIKTVKRWRQVSQIMEKYQKMKRLKKFAKVSWVKSF